MTCPKSRCLRGFTLLELLVVLAIAGLLMAVVPPVISSVMPGTELKSAARELAVALKDARLQAISRGAEVNVTFQQEPAGYTIGNEPAQLLPKNIQLHIFSPAALKSGRNTVATAHSAATRALRFFPDGSSSGSVISLRRDDTSYAVSADWLMGRITVTQVADDAL